MAEASLSDAFARLETLSEADDDDIKTPRPVNNDVEEDELETEDNSNEQEDRPLDLERRARALAEALELVEPVFDASFATLSQAPYRGARQIVMPLWDAAALDFGPLDDGTAHVLVPELAIYNALVGGSIRRTYVTSDAALQAWLSAFYVMENKVTQMGSKTPQSVGFLSAVGDYITLLGQLNQNVITTRNTPIPDGCGFVLSDYVRPCEQTYVALRNCVDVWRRFGRSQSIESCLINDPNEKCLRIIVVTREVLITSGVQVRGYEILATSRGDDPQALLSVLDDNMHILCNFDPADNCFKVIVSAKDDNEQMRPQGEQRVLIRDGRLMTVAFLSITLTHDGEPYRLSNIEVVSENLDYDVLASSLPSMWNERHRMPFFDSKYVVWLDPYERVINEDVAASVIAHTMTNLRNIGTVPALPDFKVTALKMLSDGVFYAIVDNRDIIALQNQLQARQEELHDGPIASLRVTCQWIDTREEPAGDLPRRNELAVTDLMRKRILASWTQQLICMSIVGIPDSSPGSIPPEVTTAIIELVDMLGPHMLLDLGTQTFTKVWVSHILRARHPLFLVDFWKRVRNGLLKMVIATDTKKKVIRLSPCIPPPPSVILTNILASLRLADVNVRALQCQARAIDYPLCRGDAGTNTRKYLNFISYWTNFRIDPEAEPLARLGHMWLREMFVDTTGGVNPTWLGLQGEQFLACLFAHLISIRSILYSNAAKRNVRIDADTAVEQIIDVNSVFMIVNKQAASVLCYFIGQFLENSVYFPNTRSIGNIRVFENAASDSSTDARTPSHIPGSMNTSSTEVSWVLYLRNMRQKHSAVASKTINHIELPSITGIDVMGNCVSLLNELCTTTPCILADALLRFLDVRLARIDVDEHTRMLLRFPDDYAAGSDVYMVNRMVPPRTGSPDPKYSVATSLSYTMSTPMTPMPVSTERVTYIAFSETRYASLPRGDARALIVATAPNFTHDMGACNVILSIAAMTNYHSAFPFFNDMTFVDKRFENVILNTGNVDILGRTMTNHTQASYLQSAPESVWPDEIASMFGVLYLDRPIALCARAILRGIAGDSIIACNMHTPRFLREIGDEFGGKWATLGNAVADLSAHKYLFFSACRFLFQTEIPPDPEPINPISQMTPTSFVFTDDFHEMYNDALLNNTQPIMSATPIGTNIGETSFASGSFARRLVRAMMDNKLGKSLGGCQMTISVFPGENLFLDGINRTFKAMRETKPMTVKIVWRLWLDQTWPSKSAAVIASLIFAILSEPSVPKNLLPRMAQFIALVRSDQLQLRKELFEHSAKMHPSHWAKFVAACSEAQIM